MSRSCDGDAFSVSARLGDARRVRRSGRCGRGSSRRGPEQRSLRRRCRSGAPRATTWRSTSRSRRRPRGHVLVVDVGDVDDRGYWGEVLTTGAESRGLVGLVIDGGVRDIGGIAAHGFPVFSACGRAPRGNEAASRHGRVCRRWSAVSLVATRRLGGGRRRRGDGRARGLHVEAVLDAGRAGAEGIGHVRGAPRRLDHGRAARSGREACRGRGSLSGRGSSRSSRVERPGSRAGVRRGPRTPRRRRAGPCGSGSSGWHFRCAATGPPGAHSSRAGWICRLLFVDVEPGGEYRAVGQSARERSLVDDGPPRGVDEHSVAAEKLELPAPDHVAGLVGERYVEAHDVRRGFIRSSRSAT